MSLAEDLKKIKIFNPHNLTRDGNPIIYYNSDTGRGGTGQHWVICVKGKSFEGPWYQHGDIWVSFWSMEGNTHNEKKASGLAAALAKVKEMFPDLEMVKGPWRDTWVNKTDLDAAKNALKAHKEEPK